MELIIIHISLWVDVSIIKIFSIVQEHFKVYKIVLNILLTFIRYRIANNIIILNELLLLRDHVLQVNNSPRLKLQVEEQLHVLTLQEVVLYHKFQVVLHVVVADARLD